MINSLRRFSLALAFSISIASLACCAGDRVDFHNQLIPVFTKHGCNSGACHGAAIGRGGFKLSLYGGDPSSDYEAIVRQLGGRRVNLSRPTESLIVLKPAEYVAHGGGTVIDYDSEAARLLITWIKQGAHPEALAHLERIEVTPKRTIAKHRGQIFDLRTLAFYDDGSKRDVTNWTVFRAEDPTAVEVDSESARARVLRRGRHIVVARYLNEVVPIEFVVPLSDLHVDLADEPQNNFIDAEVLETLAILGLPPSPIIDDSAFLRRASLDLTGRLPAKDVVDEMLANRKPNKHIRRALVDDFLFSDEFANYWTLQLAKLLRIRPQPNVTQGARTYHNWLADQVRSHLDYRQFARTLILSRGDSHQVGPANFYRTTKGPREQAEFVSELFMGSRLRCANCHNHPLDHWTQDDYHGMAAIFAQVEFGRVIKAKQNGRVIHPRTRQPAAQRIPGEQTLVGDANGGREQLAEWLTDDSNPYFAKAIVNRLWKHMMGRGLVEPVDDFRATNPATHPVLLNRLADDFVANGYSLRHTLRVIANSSTYARSANANAKNKDDDRFYSHAFHRPLEAEVLADAISDVLGVSSKYGDQPPGTRAVMLVNPKTPSVTLDILGRCSRESSCDSSIAATSGLAKKLHLFNGELLNARISAKGSRLVRLLDAGMTAEEIIEEFYRVALARLPTANESQHWSQQLDSANDRRAFLEDFVWGLTTCREFVTNH